MPAWVVFLLAMAVVFGLYYLWVGTRNFLESGGRGIIESTRQAVIVNTATAAVVQRLETNAPTLRPTSTEIPPCQEFTVIVPSAIVRERPSTSAPIVTSLSYGSAVCVIERESGSEWYLVDSNTRTRRLEPAYMHESVIKALYPTPTPSRTFTPAPTITPLPTESPTITPSITLSPTYDPSITETPSSTPSPTPSVTPSPTAALQNI